MLGKLLPVVFLVVGAGAGIGAGMFLMPSAEEEQMAEGEDGQEESGDDVAKDDHGNNHDDAVEPSEVEYVPFTQQFIVPVVKKDRVTSMVVLSLSLETGPGGTEVIFNKEPKLRDAFLRVMFEHANRGGFAGTFTNPDQLDMLRIALREVGQQVAGSTIHDVLIVDIARKDS
ncbi:flagellar basal body-associated FliL family protein [Chachezhania antarctica]|uniref:flagellar basal body-associated FliL family protein n=1 Tax=Chachezhania antarctica TaxID=2340860 RepID=UPI000EAE9A70|nr:flagellar basal body-associated FliL family protein [Chachezhania antarctica]|tara:strand:- start:9300 stop:9815 length:516 start_codon:yes stop_codon:yes gene_type:complete